MRGLLLDDFSNVKKGSYGLVVFSAIFALVFGFTAFQPHASTTMKLAGEVFLPSLFVLVLAFIGAMLFHFQDEYRLKFIASFRKLFKVHYRASVKHHGILQARANDELSIRAKAIRSAEEAEESFVRDSVYRKRASVEEVKQYYAELTAKEKTTATAAARYDLACQVARRGKLNVMTYEQYLAL